MAVSVVGCKGSTPAPEPEPKTVATPVPLARPATDGAAPLLHFNVPPPEKMLDPVVLGIVLEAPMRELSFPVAGTIIELPLSAGRFVSRDLPAGRLDPTPFRQAIEDGLAVRTRALSDYTAAEGALRRQQLRFEAGAVLRDAVEEAQAIYEDASSTLQLADSFVENARHNESLISITGGAEGTVERVLAEPGDAVRAKQAVYLVRTSQPLLVECSIPTTALAHLAGFQIRPEADWIDVEPRLIEQASEAEGETKLILEIAGRRLPLDSLRGGSALPVRVRLTPRHEPIRVPHSAVFQLPGEAPYVRVVTENGWEHRPVTITHADANGITLASGLSGSEKLLLAQ